MRGDAFKRWLGLPGMAGSPPETGLAAVTRLLQALRQARQMTTSADFHVLSIDSADLAGLQVAPSQAVISQAQREGVSWLCADSRLLRKARDENKENCQPGMHVLLLKDDEICYQGVVAHTGQTSQILSELLWRDPRYSMVLDISQLAPVTPALPYQAYKAADSASKAGLHPSHSLARAHASSNGGTHKSVLRGSTSLPPSRQVARIVSSHLLQSHGQTAGCLQGQRERQRQHERQQHERRPPQRQRHEWQHERRHPA